MGGVDHSRLDSCWSMSSRRGEIVPGDFILLDESHNQLILVTKNSEKRNEKKRKIMRTERSHRAVSGRKRRASGEGGREGVSGFVEISRDFNVIIHSGIIPVDRQHSALHALQTIKALHYHTVMRLKASAASRLAARGGG